MDDHEREHLICQLKEALDSMPKGVMMTQLYLPKDKDELIESQYGFIPYRRWLQLEKARIEQEAGRVAEIVELDRSVSLFVNRVAERAH